MFSLDEVMSQMTKYIDNGFGSDLIHDLHRSVAGALCFGYKGAVLEGYCLMRYVIANTFGVLCCVRYGRVRVAGIRTFSWT